MKRHCFIIFCLWMLWSLPQASAFSLQAADSDVREILRSAARLGNINLVLDDSVKGRVSLQLRDVPPEEAIRLIALARGFSLTREGDVLVVTNAAAIGQGFSRVHIFPIRYADMDTVLAAVKLSLHEEGFPSKMQNIIGSTHNAPGNEQFGEVEKFKNQAQFTNAAEKRLMIDRDTNALLFRGTDEQAAAAREIIRQLDVPAQQVSLEAQVVALQKDAAKKLGVSWEWSSLPAALGAEGQRQWKGRNAVPGAIRFGRSPMGCPMEFYYEAAIDAMVSDGQARILSRPNITTIQGREAVINIGGEVPVPVVSTTNSTTTTSMEYRSAGIILRYTPCVNAGGYITAKVHTEVSSPLYVDELKAYRFHKRAADTTVRLKDGETMVIGGLIGSEESRSLSKVPFLGDLPILGAFFRSIRNSSSDSEVMIFLTAHVLDGSKKTLGEKEYGN